MNLKRLKLSAKSSELEVREDLFQKLPDEMLLNIMFFLPLRDAARTSILSHRWKNMWKFTRVLELDPPKYDHISPISLVILEERRKKYSTWVNQVLNSHEGAEIEAFIIYFDLDDTYKSQVDSWIEYALRKNVQVLEVDLCWEFSGNRYNHGLNFSSFPKQILSYSSIKVLRHLHLRCVEVSGSVLENILSTCPNLCNLGVFASSTLLGLKVCDVPSPKLKYLDIRYCDNMNYLEISAPNLIRLTYIGPATSMIQIHHAPKLVTLRIAGRYCMHKFPLSSKLSPCFPRIQNLMLDYMLGVDWDITPHEFPEFNVVKYLHMWVHTKDEDSLLPFMSLIRRCPMLHKLEVEFVWHSRERSSRKVEERRGEELKCLKVLEFRSFYGHTADIELVICILENAPYLEKVIFNPRNSLSQREQTSEGKDVSIWDLILNDKRRAARECARLLVKKHSPNAQLVLL